MILPQGIIERILQPEYNRFVDALNVHNVSIVSFVSELYNPSINDNEIIDLMGANITPEILAEISTLYMDIEFSSSLKIGVSVYPKVENQTVVWEILDSN